MGAMTRRREDWPGEVHGFRGSNVQGIVVEAYDVESPRRAAVGRTNRQGDFRLAGLEPGRGYYVRIDAREVGGPLGWLTSRDTVSPDRTRAHRRAAGTRRLVVRLVDDESTPATDGRGDLVEDPPVQN